MRFYYIAYLTLLINQSDGAHVCNSSRIFSLFKNDVFVKVAIPHMLNDVDALFILLAAKDVQAIVDVEDCK